MHDFRSAKVFVFQNVQFSVPVTNLKLYIDPHSFQRTLLYVFNRGRDFSFSARCPKTTFHISPVERPVIYSEELRNTVVTAFFLLRMDTVVQKKKVQYLGTGRVDGETKSFDL